MQKIARVRGKQAGVSMCLITLLGLVSTRLILRRRNNPVELSFILHQSQYATVVHTFITSDDFPRAIDQLPRRRKDLHGFNFCAGQAGISDLVDTLFLLYTSVSLLLSHRITHIPNLTSIFSVLSY